MSHDLVTIEMKTLQGVGCYGDTWEPDLLCAV